MVRRKQRVQRRSNLAYYREAEPRRYVPLTESEREREEWEVRYAELSGNEKRKRQETKRENDALKKKKKEEEKQRAARMFFAHVLPWNVNTKANAVVGKARASPVQKELSRVWKHENLKAVLRLFGEEDEPLALCIHISKHLLPNPVSILSSPAAAAEVCVHEVSEAEAHREEEFTVLVDGTGNDGGDTAAALIRLCKATILCVRARAMEEMHDNATIELDVLVSDDVINDAMTQNQMYRNWFADMRLVMQWLRPDVADTDRERYANARDDEAAPGVSMHVYDAERNEEDHHLNAANADVDADAASDGDEEERGFDPSAIFDAVLPTGNEPMLDKKPEGLLPDMRPYQSRATRWMLKRERDVQKLSTRLHPLWRSLTVYTTEQAQPPTPTPQLPSSSSSTSVQFQIAQRSARGGTHAARASKGKAKVETERPEEGAAAASMDVSVRTLQYTPRVVYYNPYTGRFAPKAFPHEGMQVRGGILSDEMGLGKTVEVLACILSNRNVDCVMSQTEAGGGGGGGDGGGRTTTEVTQRACCKQSWLEFQSRPMPTSHSTSMSSFSDDATWLCGKCARSYASAHVSGETKTTLIVCPDALMAQWVSEIKRHIDTRVGFKMMVYTGQRQDAAIGGHASSIATARDFASCDVVVTTYEALKSDIHHDAHALAILEENTADGNVASVGSRRVLRHEKRYEIIPTPFTRLRWWRVCLDEAQMVDGGMQSLVVKMALTLDAVNKWCVTGTPISRGLQDVHALLRFLRCSPWDDVHVWKKVVQDPYELGKGKKSLHAELRELMWRNTKDAVASEIRIPGQAELVTKLQLNAVERHFYRTQYKQCSNIARQTILRMQNGKDRFLNEVESGDILGKLTLLRQACSHPQVGRNRIRGLDKEKNNQPMTMGDILKVLVERNRLEVEEAQRFMVVSLNGLAGIQAIKRDYAGAVASYREVLSVSEENLREEVRLDPLLKLHTCFNLHKLLSTDTETMKKEWLSIPARTLRDGMLEDETKEIKDKYQEEATSATVSRTMDFDASHSEANTKLDACGGLLGSGWWTKVLQVWASDADGGRAFMEHMKTQLISTSGHQHRDPYSVRSRCRNVSGLSMVLHDCLEDIDEKRKTMLTIVEELKKVSSQPKQYDIYKAGRCSRCRHREMENSDLVCIHCEKNLYFVQYEARLFHFDCSCAPLEKGKGKNSHNYMDMDDAVESFAMQDRRINLDIQRQNELTLNTSSAQSASTRTMEIRRGRGGLAKITHIASETESVLRMIFARLRDDQRFSELILLAKDHLDAIAVLRTEFFNARAMCLAQREVLARLDELDMSMSTMQLAAEGEEVPVYEEALKVHNHEVGWRENEFVGDKKIYMDDLRKARGQLRYLRGLSRRFEMETDAAKDEPDAADNGGAMTTSSALPAEQNASIEIAAVSGSVRTPPIEEDSPCPICREKLGFEFFILPCGHMLCPECKSQLEATAHFSSGRAIRWNRHRIRCPMCKAATRCDDIAHVDNTVDRIASRALQTASLGTIVGSGTLPWDGGVDAMCDEAAIEVNGSYSTKVEAVVRRLLWLQQMDASMKTIVFSEWVDTLDIVAHALMKNGIRFAIARRKNFTATLDRFKRVAVSTATLPASNPIEDESVNVLLMPFALGANGLNIVEAQHIVLMEPLLDPGTEVQAMGRIHRIGQTRVTVVHRFVVSESIEEKVSQVFAKRVEAMSNRLVGQSKGRSKTSRNMRVSEIAALLAEDE